MNLFKKIIETFTSLFLSGLFALLPAIITIALLKFTFSTIENLLAPIRPYLPELLKKIPYSEFGLALVFILAVGAILNVILIRQLIRSFERMISRMPLIKPIYMNSKQLIRAFTAQDQGFQQVVLVEFPKQNSYAIGFLTGSISTRVVPDAPEQLFNIFVPTTPNPTAGFYILVPQSGFRTLSLSRQEAMALIMSGGIIVPERLK